MREPTYIYEKGVGWVPRTERFITCFSIDQKHRITIYDRRPKLGENYVDCDIWFNEDGTAQLEKFRDHVVRFQWGRAAQLTSESYASTCVTIVIEPVSDG